MLVSLDERECCRSAVVDLAEQIRGVGDFV